MLLHLGDKTINNKSWQIINNECVEMRYNEKSEYNVEAEYIYIYQ